jgi:hypothetical protein
MKRTAAARAARLFGRAARAIGWPERLIDKPVAARHPATEIAVARG